MTLTSWINGNYIELFGAVTGIIYVLLEIRQNLWLWPVGIITSAVYIWVFLTGKLYADMSLQGYYLIISALGWYWWVIGLRQKAEGGRGEREIPQIDSLFEELALSEAKVGQVDVKGKPDTQGLPVTSIKLRLAITLSVVFALLYSVMWIVLDRLTDSPVPGWDAFITSLSIIATWMLARKIIEHWYLWIIVNGVAVILFLSRGLYPTVILYGVYFAMSFIGLREWSKSLKCNVSNPLTAKFSKNLRKERKGKS
jgi:nicotinamide mononucleotide transporter